MRAAITKSLMPRLFHFLFAFLFYLATSCRDAPVSDPVEVQQKTATISEGQPERRIGIAWGTDLPYGTFSSPRIVEAVDKPEVLIAFGTEFAVAGGVMALDVATGKARWRVDSENELFATPVPIAAWPGVEQPWLFGGRDGQLHAVDIVTGRRLWRFRPFGPEGRVQGVYNFYTGITFDDVDDDGVQDYVVTNGGDSKRGPFEARPIGNLMVISGADGHEIHRLPFPHGEETYCSPMLWQRLDEQWIVFGSGGETFPGALWGVPVSSIRNGTLDGLQTVVKPVEFKGVVAPPSFADVDGDSTLDLIAAPFDGRLVVISGHTLKTLWSFDSEVEEETQASPAVGDVDGDGDIDVVHFVQVGVFPRWTASVLRAFDAASGSLIWTHRIDSDLVPASPLIVDVDVDGRDEVLLIRSDPALMRGGQSNSRLQIVHIEEDRFETLAEVAGFNSGTGWVGDADGDGWLEWFIPMRTTNQYGSLVRLNLDAQTPPAIAWGGYLGTQHDGVYYGKR